MSPRLLGAILASSLTTGCVTEAMVQARLDRYAKSNAERSAAAIQEHFARNHLTPVATSYRSEVGYVPDASGYSAASPKTTLVVVARAPAHGLRADEWLLRTPDDGKAPPQLVFATSNGASCGCGGTCEAPLYSFATAPDGHLVILRLSPRVDEHRVTRSGTCNNGCGHAVPPPQPTGYGLPAIDAATVEIHDGSYDMDTLKVTCMHEDLPA